MWSAIVHLSLPHAEHMRLNYKRLITNETASTRLAVNWLPGQAAIKRDPPKPMGLASSAAAACA
jgi:hypothetical protein